MTNIMRIKVDRQALANFRRRAIRRYPKEHLESLWGHVLPNQNYTVIEFRCEELAYASSSEIAPADDDAGRFGIKDGKLVQLGLIHSHPGNWDSAPSEADWTDSQKSGELISGVLAIRKINDRTKTSLQFYFARAMCQTEIV